MFEVAEHLVAVGDRVHVAQRCGEEPSEVFFAGDDCGDDLVQVQIAEALRRRQVIDAARAGMGEQDAVETRHVPLTYFLP